jgi:hypothetical protein
MILSRASGNVPNQLMAEYYEQKCVNDVTLLNNYITLSSL